MLWSKATNLKKWKFLRYASTWFKMRQIPSVNFRTDKSIPFQTLHNWSLL